VPGRLISGCCSEQLAVDEKSNEIIAVPKLLEMLSLKSCIVTADALNCQRAIAAQVVAQGGDYVLALKTNQPSLHDDVRLFLDDPQRSAEVIHTTVDGQHGRIETRTSLVSADIGWLQKRHAWPGVAAIGKVVRTREVTAKVTTETAYYLLSPPLTVERFGQVVRAHWGIENGLHWVLDVTMNEDQTRNRRDHAPLRDRHRARPLAALDHDALRPPRAPAPGADRRHRGARLENLLPAPAPADHPV
jgi:predicted transposase YbfD/YdcC